MICTTILSLFLGCSEPVHKKQGYERNYIEKQHSRKLHKEHRGTRKEHGRCGRASFYGKELSGRRTANGERFNPGGLTAASWHHQFGSRVTVINQKNGRSVTVRINDRGPNKRLGRIIDLSEGAFRKLAHVGQGIIKVCLM